MSMRALIAAGLLTGIFVGGAMASDKAECPPPPGGPGGFGPGGHPGGPGHPPFGPPMGGLMKDADADKDGRITRAEIDRAIAKKFGEADSNRDGVLSESEFAAALPKPPERPGVPPEGGPKPPEGGPPRPHFDPVARFKATDWNGDGKITPDEFAVPMKAMAIMADRNGDGAITEDEMRGPPRGPKPPR